MQLFRTFGLCVTTLALACGDGEVSGIGTTTGNGPVATNAVTVQNLSFDPSDIVVAAGTSVTWTWNTSVTHNVTFTVGAGSADQGGAGVTFTRTFPTTGTFAYHCTIHPGMNGSVKVQ